MPRKRDKKQSARKLQIDKAEPQLEAMIALLYGMDPASA